MEKRFVAISLVCLAVGVGLAGQGILPSPGAGKGVALVITGAAARIPQEAALLEALDERGLLDDLAFVSGDSSGALNAIAMIMSTEGQGRTTFPMRPSSNTNRRAALVSGRSSS